MQELLRAYRHQPGLKQHPMQTIRTSHHYADLSGLLNVHVMPYEFKSSKLNHKECKFHSIKFVR